MCRMVKGHQSHVTETKKLQSFIKKSNIIIQKWNHSISRHQGSRSGWLVLLTTWVISTWSSRVSSSRVSSTQSYVPWLDSYVQLHTVYIFVVEAIFLGFFPRREDMTSSSFRVRACWRLSVAQVFPFMLTQPATLMSSLWNCAFLARPHGERFTTWLTTAH